MYGGNSDHSYNDPHSITSVSKSSHLSPDLNYTMAEPILSVTRRTLHLQLTVSNFASTVNSVLR